MRASFPRGDDVLSALGDQVGETLASGEFPGVYYAAATQFAGLDPRAQLECLARLFATAASSSWLQK